MTTPETAVIWDARIPDLAWRRPIPDGEPWLLHTGDPLLLNSILRQGLEGRWNLVVAPAHWTADQVHAAARRHSISGILTGALTDPRWRETGPVTQPSTIARAEGSLGIFTSGTSGEPKLAVHAWNRIRLPGEFAARRLPAARWLMTYNPVAYAGLQVFFTALATGGAIIYPTAGAADAAKAVLDLDVEAISATPTWWRMFLTVLPQETAKKSLLQASLGGERVDQALLNAIRARFNPQRLTHIYASTEAGSAIVVSDGREGFPAAWLEDKNRAVHLRIRDGFLEIASPYQMVGYVDSAGSPLGTDGWYRTPDLVELRGDRVHFLGRSDIVANIGGVKVMLEEVEQALMELGWFSDCRIYARPSPLTGMILCADVVPAPGHVVEVHTLKRALASRLPRHAQPQLVKVVSGLQLSANGKKLRS